MSNENGQWVIDRTNAHPLPPDLFMELLGISLDAMRGRRREIPPNSERCLEEAPPNTLFLTDCPENQMAMSVFAECRRRFPTDEKEAGDTGFSFLMRWFAVQKTRAAGKFKDFTRIGDTPNSEMINSAVFAAAAECPLSLDGDFDDSFVGRTRKLMDDGDNRE